MDIGGGATQPNPFAMPTDASTGPTIPTDQRGFQHGSLEHNTGTGSRVYLNGMTPPRSPSARGQRRTRDRERTSSRDEERRSNRAEHPVGCGFRFQAVETSLRQHQNELSAQRLEIGKLKQMVNVLMSDKEETNSKLDSVFGHVDSKFTEATNKIDFFFESAKAKFQSLTDIMNGLAQTTQGRLDAMSATIDQIRANPVTHDSTHGTFEAQQRPTVSQVPAAAPPSWTDSQVPLISPSPAFGITVEGNVFGTNVRLGQILRD